MYNYLRVTQTGNYGFRHFSGVLNEMVAVITSAITDRKAGGGGRNWKRSSDDAANFA